MTEPPLEVPAEEPDDDLVDDDTPAPTEGEPPAPPGDAQDDC